MKKCMFALLVLVVGFGSQAFAADDPVPYPVDRQLEWEKNNPDSLPIWPTPEELGRWHEIGQGFLPTAPPSGSIRQPGEFEPMEGVLIRYPFGIPYALIKEMSLDTKVVTIVASSSQQTTVHNNYVSNGVNTSNCTYLIASSDSYWTRDYGPWCIIEDDHAGIVDTIYNRPRPNDDKIPTKYAQNQGLPYFAMSLITAGGNYMCDGQGIACSTDLTWSENPGMTHQQIDQMVLDYLGITKYHVIPDALGQYIKHIDCWAKFLAPDKIMIIEVPPSHSAYTKLENAVDYWEQQISCYGTLYEVSRVYCPGGQAYINGLILNNKVIIAKENSQWDDDAVLAYQQAMPGYDVVNFTGSWYDTDAIHCRTMGLADRYMLYIAHTPLLDQKASPSGFYVEADVTAYSNQPFTNNTPMLYWKTTGGWNSVQMAGAGGDTYDAYIPTQPDGTVISYYINAQDASGRSENHPYIGEMDAHMFQSYDPVLGADVFTIDERLGGTVNFSLNAGAANAGRNYILLGSVTGTSPGFALPGGYVTLPLNWDVFTDFVLLMLNTPAFSNFLGQLDVDGRADAQLNSPALPTGTAGLKINFAYACNNFWDFVSNPVEIEIVD